MTFSALDKAFEELEEAVKAVARASNVGHPHFVHVDDWLDQVDPLNQPDEDEAYARFVLELLRFPAWKQVMYKSIIQSFPLYCTFEGQPYRVTGASRLGDIWLNYPDKVDSYLIRLPVTHCSQWRKVANP